MIPDPRTVSDAQTTPVGVRTNCPQCGVQLDSFTTSCGSCGAVITGGTMDAERAERMRSRLQDGIGAGYKLGDMLGRGGMGIVFQARELSLDRDVALKVLAFDPILNPDAYARFEREAKLAARLDHPNIVPIFSVGQGNGIAFYTMRMVRGGSVEGLVAGGRALDVEQAVPILRDVAAALDYAHAQGVVHRDIKPANVLLSDSGHALVADFGIARAFGGPTASGGTATGTGVVGSPAYMSPEQWRGEKVDGRADQYALGVLAFELLAGQRPFAGDSMQELLRMHLQDDAPDIISVRHDLPSHLTDAIRRAMAKDPAARYESSSAFVQELHEPRSGARSAAAPLRPAVVPISAAQTVRTPPPPPLGARTAGAGAKPPAGGVSTVEQEVHVDEQSTREKRSIVPWLVLLVIAGAGAGIIWKLAPPRETSPAATVAAVNLDSIAEVERNLQSQIEQARRTAMLAERRADSLAANPGRGAAGGAGAAAPPREVPHAHLYVLAQGGTPQLVIDGQVLKEIAPAVVQVTPGRHRVSVRGGQEFLPADTIIELAAEDTGTVVFRTRRIAEQQRQGVAFAPQGVPLLSGAVDARGFPIIDWKDVTTKLGFDPRTADPRRLTPDQKLRLRRFQFVVDSVKRNAGRAGRAGVRRP